MNILFKFIAEQLQWTFIIIYVLGAIVAVLGFIYLFFDDFKRK